MITDLKYYVLDKLEDFVNEHASQRKFIINRAQSFDKELLMHLGKLYAMPDDDSVNHHISDICIWILDVAQMKCKSSKPQMSKLILSNYTDDRQNGRISVGVAELCKLLIEKEKTYPNDKFEILSKDFTNRLTHFVKKLDNLDWSTSKPLQKLLRDIFIDKKNY